jgi:hypothetical protein
MKPKGTDVEGLIDGTNFFIFTGASIEAQVITRSRFKVCLESMWR